jgi:hypothetical protein
MKGQNTTTIFTQTTHSYIHMSIKFMLSLRLIKHYAMKMYGGVEVQLQLSWPLQWIEMSGQLHTPSALPPGKRARYPLGRRLDGSQSWSLHTVE